MNDIITQAQMQELVERNKNAPYTPPVSTAWTDNRGVCATMSQLLELNRRAGLADQRPFDAADQSRWMRSLHSRKWTVQDTGKNVARLIERPVKVAGGWRHLPLNGRAA